MAVYAHGIIERIDILEYEAASMLVILDFKPIEPFTLNERVERFDACVVPWICLLREAVFHAGDCLAKLRRNVLAASVTMDYEWIGQLAPPFGLFDG